MSKKAVATQEEKELAGMIYEAMKDAIIPVFQEYHCPPVNAGRLLLVFVNKIFKRCGLPKGTLQKEAIEVENLPTA